MKAQEAPQKSVRKSSLLHCVSIIGNKVGYIQSDDRHGYLVPVSRAPPFPLLLVLRC